MTTAITVGEVIGALGLLAVIVICGLVVYFILSAIADGWRH